MGLEWWFVPKRTLPGKEGSNPKLSLGHLLKSYKYLRLSRNPLA